MKGVVMIMVCMWLPVLLHANIVVRDANARVVNNDTITVVEGGVQQPPFTELICYLYAENNSNTVMNMGLKQTEFVLSANASHSICFAKLCYPSSVYVLPVTAMVPPTGIDSGFSGHYTFDKLVHMPATDLVAYTFFDADNPTDSAIVYVKYNTLTAPPSSNVATVAAEAGINIYPNPATDVLHVNMEKTPHANALLQLLDAGGRVLATQQPHKGHNSIDIAQLPQGAYVLRYTNAETNTILKIAK